MPNMTDRLYRFKITWTGWPGGPGLTTFYTSQDSSVVTSANGFFRTFFEAIKAYSPSGVTLTYPSSVDDIDSVTGNIGVPFAVTAPAPTVCSSPDHYAAPAGAQVRWHTNGVQTQIPPKHGTRVVVGSTMIVPISSSQFGTDGTLDSAYQSVLLAAANALRVSFAENLRIWSRPVFNPSGGVVRSGFNSPVVSASVKDQAAILRSRRN